MDTTPRDAMAGGVQAFFVIHLTHLCAVRARCATTWSERITFRSDRRIYSRMIT